MIEQKVERAAKRVNNTIEQLQEPKVNRKWNHNTKPKEDIAKHRIFRLHCNVKYCLSYNNQQIIQ